jgi:hypothetical protein
MTEFERALQECLSSLERGESDLNACLARYPQYAAELEPVLRAHTWLEGGRSAAQPPAGFQTRGRQRLARDLAANPRRRALPLFGYTRLAGSLAGILFAFLAAGTAYAQAALPGHPFYAWKLASEHAWRLVSPDPVATDLALADRRVHELAAVSGDPRGRSIAMDAYSEVLARLQSEMDEHNQDVILPVLQSQSTDLEQGGLPVPTFVPGLVPPVAAPAASLTVTPTPTVLSDFPTPQPRINATGLPKVAPTIEVPPPIR